MKSCKEGLQSLIIKRNCCFVHANGSQMYNYKCSPAVHLIENTCFITWSADKCWIKRHCVRSTSWWNKYSHQGVIHHMVQSAGCSLYSENPSSPADNWLSIDDWTMCHFEPLTLLIFSPLSNSLCVLDLNFHHHSRITVSYRAWIITLWCNLSLVIRSWVLLAVCSPAWKTGFKTTYQPPKCSHCCLATKNCFTPEYSLSVLHSGFKHHPLCTEGSFTSTADGSLSKIVFSELITELPLRDSMLLWERRRLVTVDCPPLLHLLSSSPSFHQDSHCAAAAEAHQVLLSPLFVEFFSGKWTTLADAYMFSHYCFIHRD